MDIEFFMPQGPQPTEMVGLAELRRSLPPQWKGFANFVMRQPGRRGQDREIDVVLIAQDRVILVDLKHHRGKIENRGGYWYRGNSRIGTSPAHKIRENAKVLASLVQRELPQLRTVPPIESVVVLTNPTVDPSGLDNVERERTLKLPDFLRIADQRFFRSVFTMNSKVDASAPLCAGGPLSMLQRFFRNGRLFEPRRAKYHGFIPIGHAEFKHKLYSEFACHEESNPNYTGLLRLWDFSAEDEFLVEETRRPIAERERAVLGHLRIQDPAFYENYVLRSIAHDGEFTLRYSEVFDRLPDLERMARFAPAITDLPIERRTELSRLFLDRVASLHRVRVAHRDLDRHSVWIDDGRSKVVLSGFGAAHYPERASIGGARSKLLAGGSRVPEDAGRAKPGTPFQHDVFLAGTVVWGLLTGNRLPLDGNVPNWIPSAIGGTDVPEQYGDWFARSLDVNPQSRFPDAVEAADAFAELIRKGEKVSLERQLERYRRDVDPISDYPPENWMVRKPHRIYRSAGDGADFFVKSWPERSLGDRRRSAARLIEFFARAEALQRNPDWAPRIDIACLCADGLLLVQEWIRGKTLADTDVATWSGDTCRAFISGLIKAVNGLHSLGLAHGDLSPANIMLREAGTPGEPVLVDLLDFTLDAEGKSTPAYCPPDEHDLRARDRFAVSTVAKEIAGHLVSEDKTAIERGAEKCGEGDAPWLTLKPLADALIPAKAAVAQQALNIIVELRNAPFEGEMLADNGMFHVVRPNKRNAIEIFGFDQRLMVELDAKDSKPGYARADRVSSNALNWARNAALFSLEARIDVRRSSTKSTFSGLDELIRMVVAASPAAVAAPSIETAPAEASEPTPASPQAGKQFPVVRFWKETIAVEEEIQPEIKLVAAPRFDQDERILSLECDEGISDVMPTEGQAVVVTWNGNRVGELDAGRSKGTSVVIRNARNMPGLKASAVLKLQSNDSLTSFTRRSRAVARILGNLAEIHDLIEYFDPQTTLLPQKMGAEVKDEDLDRYDLNEDQKEAFKHLWRHGPVGLLQGPPGTGKTRFIAAFAHYALTKAGLRSVLVLSQSHEAVNTAAERILEISQELPGNVDMLRVGDHGKISPALRPYHSRAIQDRYRELFRASLKERARFPARRLGLDAGFVKEFLENEAVFGSLARQIEFAENDLAGGVDPDVIAAARTRVGELSAAWESLLQENSIRDGSHPQATLERIREDIASRHSVQDVDARSRLLRLEALGREWVSVLGTRSRNLEEFLARSRNLICGTCVGIGRRGLQIERNSFDLVIIDEAARCTPGELAVGMQSGTRVLLVGDQAQLPPLFGHQELREVAARLGFKSRKDLAKSDFERAFDSEYGKVVQQVLKRQYRMAPKIGNLVAKAFYPDRELQNERGDPPKYYGLLPRPFDDELTWIDTGYSRTTRRESEVEDSFMNRREGAAIVEALKKISSCDSFIAAAKSDLKEGEPLIGVICMYAPQADHVDDLILQSDLPAGFKQLIKTGTVDSYQGKENAIVIVSLVRSNPEFDMGFVRTANRVNVALSRAKERLIIVGSARMYGGPGNSLKEVVATLRSAGRIFPDEMPNPGGGRERTRRRRRR